MEAGQWSAQVTVLSHVIDGHSILTTVGAKTLGKGGCGRPVKDPPDILKIAK